MTRTLKIRLTAAGVVFAVAAAATFLLTGHHHAPTTGTPSQAHAAPPPALPNPPPAPVDPQVLAEVRDAYRKSLAENAPPAMLDLTQGPGQPADGLRPPADPFVTPARFNPDPVGDLPPLPAGVAAPPAAQKAKETPASDLPPLPPAGSPR